MCISTSENLSGGGWVGRRRLLSTFYLKFDTEAHIYELSGAWFHAYICIPFYMISHYCASHSSITHTTNIFEGKTSAITDRLPYSFTIGSRQRYEQSHRERRDVRKAAYIAFRRPSPVSPRIPTIQVRIVKGCSPIVFRVKYKSGGPLGRKGRRRKYRNLKRK
jgi:hypothetical protein